MSTESVVMDIQCRLLQPPDAKALARFFEQLSREGVDKYFHPHPLTSEEAERRAGYRGLDVYLVLVTNNNIVGYGMLRGWEEGYAVPSLGLAIDSDSQGKGLGRLMMECLHQVARERGAETVRLKVYPVNEKAIRLYQSMGYEFKGTTGKQLVGYKSLTK